MHPPAFRLSLLSLTLAASCAQAAPNAEPIEARAEAQLRQFPGLSLHGADHTYEARSVAVDADGSSHVHFDRRVAGLRVIGGDLIVQSDSFGHLTRVHQTMRLLPKADRKASVAAFAASRSALASTGGSLFGQPELVIYARANAPQLAWEVQTHGEQADGQPFEKHVIVDARSGALLDSWDDIHTGAAAAATGNTLYSGEVMLTTTHFQGGYKLLDHSRGNTRTIDLKHGVGLPILFVDVNDVWGDKAASDNASAAADAQYGAAMTWDYYLNVHGRRGVANNRKGTLSGVHYGRNYANAFWSNSCFCMTYGDGDGTSLKPLVSLDVVGHEITHGVTSHTANLTYSGESGGLNEATSDIFGTMVEFYANNANAPGNYLIGEKVTIRRHALRYMMKPSGDGGSSDCWYAGVGDLDVHHSSGVANHFFFLLAEGTNSSHGNSPTCVAGNTRVATGNAALTGIGRDAAQKIWYRALTTKFTSSTNYATARASSILAAQELAATLGADYGPQVAAAWSAVSVN